jgi:hypothetical protein
VPSLVFAAGALAAVVCAAIVLVPSVAPPADPMATALLPQRSAVILAPLRTGFAPHRTAIAQSLMPDSRARVMVSASEMAALRQLFSGAVVAPELPEVSGEELVIPEISIAPIAHFSNPEGAGQ